MSNVDIERTGWDDTLQWSSKRDAGVNIMYHMAVLSA